MLPANINLNVLLSITRFIDCNAFKYSISLNFPIPGFTALDQVKKIPAISPVNNMARAKMIVSVFIKLFKIYTKINSINFKTVNKW
jgi:hypothetical protein